MIGRSFRTILIIVFVVVAPALADSTFPEIWTFETGSRHILDLQLWPNGKALALGTGQSLDPRGFRGFWDRSGSTVTVFFENGASVALETARSRQPIARVATDGRDPRRSKPLSITPVQGDAADWLGIWIFGERTGRHYVALRSDRTAFSQSATRGIWIPVNRGIRIEWNDGAIEVLQFDSAGPTLKSWPAGVPTRETAPRISNPERVGDAGFDVVP